MSHVHDFNVISRLIFDVRVLHCLSLWLSCPCDVSNLAPICGSPRYVSLHRLHYTASIAVAVYTDLHIVANLQYPRQGHSQAWAGGGMKPDQIASKSDLINYSPFLRFGFRVLAYVAEVSLQYNTVKPSSWEFFALAKLIETLHIIFQVVIGLFMLFMCSFQTWPVFAMFWVWAAAKPGAPGLGYATGSLGVLEPTQRRALH